MRGSRRLLLRARRDIVVGQAARGRQRERLLQTLDTVGQVSAVRSWRLQLQQSCALRQVPSRVITTLLVLIRH